MTIVWWAGVFGALLATQTHSANRISALFSCLSILIGCSLWAFFWLSRFISGGGGDMQINNKWIYFLNCRTIPRRVWLVFRLSSNQFNYLWRKSIMTSKKYFLFIILMLFLIISILPSSFNYAAKSIVEEYLPLITDNDIDHPKMSCLASQALDGAKLKIKQDKKELTANNSYSSAQNIKAIIAFIKDGLTRLASQS
jgi:hypothetical protein